MTRRLRKPVRFILHCSVLAVASALPGGCTTMWNPTPPSSEAQTVGSPVQLTRGYAVREGAHFSGDGRWIAFDGSTGGGLSHLYLAQMRFNADEAADGINRPIQITPNQQQAGSGCLSPNGTSVFFSCTPPGTSSAGAWPIMRIYRADGWQGAVAALAPGESINLAQHPITSDQGYNGQIGISPDGRWLVFVSTQEGKPQLTVMASDGSDRHNLSGADESARDPSFSPDGRQMLFAGDVDGRRQIMLASITYDSGGRPTGLTHVEQITREGGSTPCWHCDGKHVLFTAQAPDGDPELYIIRTDGSRITRLTFTAGPDTCPAVSPDGRWLIWSSTRNGSPQLFLSRFQLPQGS